MLVVAGRTRPNRFLAQARIKGVLVQLSKLVERAVEDRGEEDVWQLLDAVAAGRGGEALDRLRRLILAADDPLAARLSFFSLFASFCRQLTAIRGLMRASRVPAGEANYARFKDRHAPQLQGEVPGGGKNPIGRDAGGTGH